MYVILPSTLPSSVSVLLTLLSGQIAQFEQTLSRLENAENQIDDLKQQLDDALGAEDMVVQLTERTLEMGEVRFHLLNRDV